MGLSLEIQILNWRYDDGFPFGFPESYDADDWREPCWIGHLTTSPLEDLGSGKWQELTRWLATNCIGYYDYVWRYNGGNPFLEVRIGKDIDASAFLLQWKA